MIIVGIVLLALAGLLLFLRKKQQDQLLEIKFVKTSTVAELSDLQKSIAAEIGPGGFRQQAEVKGVCRCDTPLKGELSGQDCVYYSMSVSERYEETYTETDSQGRSSTRTRTSTTVVTSNTQAVRFSLDDGTGSITVDTAGASVDAVSVVNKYEPYRAGMTGLQFGGFTFSLGGFGGSGRRVLGYEYHESIIPLGRQLYILGDACDTGGELAMVLPQEKGKPFIVSVKSEEELTRGKEGAVKWMFVGVIVSAVAGLALIIAGALK
ncbi:MAG: hypothetical protein HY962_07285 [Ignavibacteriae bacterium]|nr:hypothetical protein [Ignavibacteriota bacterium]